MALQEYSVAFSFVCVVIISLVVAAPMPTETTPASSILSVFTDKDTTNTKTQTNQADTMLPSTSTLKMQSTATSSSTGPSTSSSSSIPALTVESSTPPVRTARSVTIMTDIKINRRTLRKAIFVAKYLKFYLDLEFLNLVDGESPTIPQVAATATGRPKIPTEIVQDAKDCTNKMTILERLRFFLLASQPWIEALPQYQAGSGKMALIVSKFRNLGEIFMDMLPPDVIHLSTNTRTVPTQDLSVVLKTLASFYTQTDIIIQLFKDLRKC